MDWGHFPPMGWVGRSEILTHKTAETTFAANFAFYCSSLCYNRVWLLLRLNTVGMRARHPSVRPSVCLFNQQSRISTAPLLLLKCNKSIVIALCGGFLLFASRPHVVESPYSWKYAKSRDEEEQERGQ